MSSPWWRQFPKTESRRPRQPTSGDQPHLAPGDLVRLREKPERFRRVLNVEWHYHRHEYVYIVETSATRFAPYWFHAQLLPEPDRTLA